MKKARGEVRKLIEVITELQGLIGQAKSVALNDRDPDQLEHTLKPLDEAFRLCVETRSDYYPTDVYFEQPAEPGADSIEEV